MNEIRKQIKLLDSSERINITYTCRTNYLRLVFELTDYELTTGDTVRLYIRDPSGNITYINGSKNMSDNSASFQVASSTFRNKGTHTGQIRITKEGKRLYSNPIQLNVHPYYGGE